MANTTSHEILDWRIALENAFSRQSEMALRLAELCRVINSHRAYRLADALNAELTSLAFSATACEELLKVIEQRTSANRSADREFKLCFPFATDAVISAFNSREFLRSTELAQCLGSANAQGLLSEFDKYLPMTTEASNAVRHHHDRAFGRVKTKPFSEHGQLIAVHGAAIMVTNERLQSFWFEFGINRVLPMIEQLAASVRAYDAR